jgi:hypothetical protein
MIAPTAHASPTRQVRRSDARLPEDRIQSAILVKTPNVRALSVPASARFENCPSNRKDASGQALLEGAWREA